MTIERKQPVANAMLHEIEPVAGNYFVSTYPPFSCWTEDAVTAYQNRLESPVSKQVPLGLYVHFPFCVERCQFCYYLSYANATEMGSYLDCLEKEISLLSEKEAFRDRDVSFVYFGGGTPSLAPTQRLDALFQQLKSSFSLEHADEVTFECAPKSVSTDKLERLRELGVTRVSMGVQQLDDDILRKNGRIHTVADVSNAWTILKELRFDVLNLDLIVGLVGETEETFSRSLDQILEMQPDSLTLYQLEIPKNTPLYRSLSEGVSPPSWETKRDRLERAIERLESEGYHAISSYTWVRDRQRHGFVYQDSQYHGADLLGLGAASFSHVQGVNHQNHASLRRYLEPISKGELPLWRAYEMTSTEQCVREFLLQLKLGKVDASTLKEKYDVDVFELFSAPLKELQTACLLEVIEREIRLTKKGRLQVDRLLPMFYLERHQGVRYS